MLTPITSSVQALGLTRDSWIWLWGRFVSGATIITGLIALGNHMLDAYLTPGEVKYLTMAAVVVLWLAGRYDSSPLPGDKK